MSTLHPARTTPLLRWSLAMSVAVCLQAVGCEFFLGTEVLDVDIPASFTVPFPITMPAQTVIDASPLDDENQREVQLPAVYVPVDLVTLVPDLAQHRGHIKSVRVNSIIHHVTANSLDVTLQPMTIRVGPVDADYDDASDLAVTMSLVPAATGSLPASISETGRSTASSHMANLSFGTGAAASFLVPSDYQTSGGSATTELLFEVTVVASPVD